MSLPHAVAQVVVDSLVPIARQLGSRLGAIIANQSFTSADRSSTITQQVRQEPRWLQAQLQYLRRKNSRERELIAINPKQQERIEEIKEDELRDRREMSRLYRDLMQQQQAGAISLKLKEMQNLWDRDTWFSNLSRQETEQILEQQQHRLLLLVSPAKISEDCPESFRYNLNIELPAKLRAFLSENYPQNSESCAVQFYGDYFKKPISDIDVERLQTVLSPISTAIIYSNISDYQVNFNIGFWLPNEGNSNIITIPAWNWEIVYDQLEKTGMKEKQNLRTIRQIIVQIHQILAAFMADLYYIGVDFNYQPRFYALGPSLNEDLLSPEWFTPYIEVLQEIQKQQQGAYEREIRRLGVQEARAATDRKKRELAEQKRRELVIAEAKRRQQLESRLKSLSWQCTHTLSGHSSFVNTVAISPNEQILVSGSWDAKIKLWNLQTGELISTLPGHEDRVNSVAISTDGKVIVSGSFDETIKIWHLPTGELFKTLPGHIMGVNGVAISPDVKVIASCGGDDNTIKFWNLQTGELLRTVSGHTGDVNSVFFSPDGSLLASGSSDCTSKVWDVKTGELIRSLSGLKLGVNSVAISADGQVLVSVRFDHTIKLRNLQTGALLRILNNDSKILSPTNRNQGNAWHILRNHVCRGNSVAIAPDGLTLISGGDDSNVKIWNMRTGALLDTLQGHSGTVYSVAIGTHSNIIVSGSSDETIKIWHCK